MNSKTKDKLMGLLRDKTSINQLLDSNNGSNSNIFNINTLVSR